MPTRRIELRPLGLACALSASMLAGCADYLNQRDSVTLAVGEAQDWNSVVHTIDPWPRAARKTDIDVDGQRTAVVMGRYSTAVAAQPTAGEPVVP